VTVSLEILDNTGVASGRRRIPRGAEGHHVVAKPIAAQREDERRITGQDEDQLGVHGALQFALELAGPDPGPP
jgi:hypothetical protein